MKKVLSIVGTRPNFVKIAALYRAFKKRDKEFDHLICHTGQHFDTNMSQVFFKELSIPKPQIELQVNPGSPDEQIAAMETGLERAMEAERPDLVLVVGDVNSTLAGARAASKLGIPLAHVEAGLRSFDDTMPEERNRIITDGIADFLFVTEQSALDNLKNEGIPDDKVFMTGNVMIDTLVFLSDKIDTSDIVWNSGLTPGDYALCTFHRPSNVDDPPQLVKLIKMLNTLAEMTTIVFPCHPRTRNAMDALGGEVTLNDNVKLTGPMGYVDFLALQKNAALVVTDSGGIQEESTFLQIPCITFRKTTERPVTVDVGTNYLVGDNHGEVIKCVQSILAGDVKKGTIPTLWDGAAADRIVEHLTTLI